MRYQLDGKKQTGLCRFISKHQNFRVLHFKICNNDRCYGRSVRRTLSKYKMVDNASVYICSYENSPSFIIRRFPSSRYVQNQIAVCIVNCVLIFPAILLNGVCIATISKSSILQIKPCNYLILIHSVVDLLIPTVSVPSFTYLMYSEIVGTAKCIIILLLTVTGIVPGALSITSICALTFERYLSVLHPIAHRNYVTKKLCTQYIIGWSFVIVTLTPIVVVSALAYNICLAFFIGSTLVLNAVAYTMIFLTVGKE
ncbi:D(3) dopamine receptor-like [Xenia sp. Carnegie-2017]|uniref:D(3) dopamine receptor-like n=1 Tax=Xenia sp. Carnegie-2017 TaxID=2897299 RepID=UPI001F04113F|nr:D(3) dopamine receptor-like [Xenia sp. Carnegie-2017]